MSALPATQSPVSPRPAPMRSMSLQVQSTIIRSEKPNKGLEVALAPNPNQMNRLFGYLPDGTKVVVAQRFGKGGMDINKIAGGKVYAVAADALSPVMEKDKDGKPTKVQKVEDGLPLYSSSGFYLLSSKDYPALDIFTGYSHLLDDGNKVLFCSDAQLQETYLVELGSALDFELLQACLQDMLGDEKNLVAPFNEGMNSRRRRAIERAKQDLEDDSPDEAAAVVEYAELPVSVKDGNPCVILSWRSAPDAPLQTTVVFREATSVNMDYEDGRLIVSYLDAEQAVEFFSNSTDGRALRQALEAGHPIKVCLTPAHLMRTSVSFRRKVHNVLEAPADKAAYGEGVYIKAALKGWTPFICSVMYSQHPKFPAQDYDSNHFVAAPRQREVTMTRSGEKSWNPPVAPTFSIVALQAKALKYAASR